MTVYTMSRGCHPIWLLAISFLHDIEIRWKHSVAQSNSSEVMFSLIKFNKRNKVNSFVIDRRSCKQVCATLEKERISGKPGSGMDPVPQNFHLSQVVSAEPMLASTVETESSVEPNRLEESTTCEQVSRTAENPTSFEPSGGAEEPAISNDVSRSDVAQASIEPSVADVPANNENVCQEAGSSGVETFSELQVKAAQMHMCTDEDFNDALQTIRGLSDRGCIPARRMQK
jgi:hypothetical protein